MIVDYKKLAEDLMDFYADAFSNDRLLYDLTAFGYSDDELKVLGFDQADIERISIWVMEGCDV